MLVDPLQEESETITSTATVTSSLVTSEASSAGQSTITVIPFNPLPKPGGEPLTKYYPTHRYCRYRLDVVQSPCQVKV